MRFCWVAAIDFKKAFDTVEHRSVWNVSREQGIEQPYIKVLAQVCDQQRATVHTDVKSKHFHLERGTKQGDPLSTLLCNPLLHFIMKPRTEKWNRDNQGVRLAEHDRDANLSNPRFADDILPISGSLKHTTMLDDLTTATTAHGLQPHPTKTKIISNTEEGMRVAVKGLNIEILPPEGNIKDLGQHFTFKNAFQVEFDHCIKCAWATFTSHIQVLTLPKYPLRDRLKHFDATVTPSLF